MKNPTIQNIRIDRIKITIVLLAICLLAVSVLVRVKAGSATVATYEILHSFTGNAGYGFTDTDGANPYGPLIQGSDGNFYGTTMNGSATATGPTGTVFKITADGQITILHHFATIANDGVTPMSGLTQANDGNLYGTTYGAPGCTGSGAGCGVLFKITTSGTYTKMFTFSGNEGGIPQAGVIQAKDGYLYGTTTKGGYDGRYVYGGTVYRVAIGSTKPTAVHLFTLKDGVAPSCDLIQGKDGALYGTAYAGAAGTGSVFRLTTSGAFTLLHTFAVADGAYPVGGLTQLGDGTMYGTTTAGGQYNLGTIFKISTSGQFSVFYHFRITDGAKPFGNLLLANDGNIYGTTNQGGLNYGTIFRITPAGVFTVLHSFGQMKGDGAYPFAGLIQASDGRLYGTTKNGGPQNKGTVFRLDLGLTPTPPPTSTPGPSPSPRVSPIPGPSPAPTVSPSPQASPSPGPGCANNTCGEVHGNGRLEERVDGTHFDFHVRFVRPSKEPKGDITFVDRETRKRFHSTSITCLLFTDTHATISGSGEIDGQPVMFTIEVKERARAEGSFSIVLSNGYRKSGVTHAGKVTLLPCRSAHALAVRNHATVHKTDHRQEITKTNWHGHPSVVASRRLVAIAFDPSKAFANSEGCVEAQPQARVLKKKN